MQFRVGINCLPVFELDTMVLAAPENVSILLSRVELSDSSDKASIQVLAEETADEPALQAVCIVSKAELAGKSLVSFNLCSKIQ